MSAQRTLIAGFSQGAIMALESTELAVPPALRIVAIAGRFATLPLKKAAASIHLLHGSADPVMPEALGQSALARLLELSVDATLDVVAGLRHEPHPALLTRLAARLAPT